MCAAIAMSGAVYFGTENRTVAGTVFVADTFDRSNRYGVNPSGSGDGQSGILAPTTYTEYADGSVPAENIVGDQAMIGGRQPPSSGDYFGLYGGFSPNYNFNDASGIDDGGGFRVTFDANPGVGGYGLYNSWVGISFGHSSANVSWYGGTTGAFDTAFRDNGQEVWSGRLYDPSAGVGRVDKTYEFEVTIITNSIQVGGAATAITDVDGVRFASSSFSWTGSANYIWLDASVSQQTYEDPTNVDNFKIEALTGGEVQAELQSLNPVNTPEPTSVALLGVGAAGLIGWRRRSAKAATRSDRRQFRLGRWRGEWPPEPNG